MNKTSNARSVSCSRPSTTANRQGYFNRSNGGNTFALDNLTGSSGSIWSYLIITTLMTKRFGSDAMNDDWHGTFALGITEQADLGTLPS